MSALGSRGGSWCGLRGPLGAPGAALGALEGVLREGFGTRGGPGTPPKPEIGVLEGMWFDPMLQIPYKNSVFSDFQKKVVFSKVSSRGAPWGSREGPGKRVGRPSDPTGSPLEG